MAIRIRGGIAGRVYPPRGGDLPGALARRAVGGLDSLVTPRGAQNVRDILHFSHLGAILPHRVAHLALLKPTYAHLSSS